jgi:hypothetical protein
LHLRKDGGGSADHEDGGFFDTLLDKAEEAAAKVATPSDAVPLEEPGPDKATE